jgi:hypothetical protein
MADVVIPPLPLKKKKRKFVIVTVKRDVRSSKAIGPSGEYLSQVKDKYVKYMDPIGFKRSQDDDNM